MKEEDYIRSLHYCPMCGTVVGCGEGDCDSRQFQEHIANCRLSSKGLPGRLRYGETDDDG
jgi:hypothetical protein